MSTSNLGQHDASETTTERGLTGEIAMRPFADEFLAHLGRTDSAHDAIRECLHILDVGTGTARIPIEISSRRRDLRFTAVDRATRAIQTARRNIEHAGLSESIRVEPAEASSLPFATATFDGVISSSLLHHVPDQVAVLREMARVLRPGGLLLVRDTLRGSDASQIAQILSRNHGTAGETQRAAYDLASRAMRDIEDARDLARMAGLSMASVWQPGPRHWMLNFREIRNPKSQFRNRSDSTNPHPLAQSNS